MTRYKIVVVASSGPAAVLRDEYLTDDGYTACMAGTPAGTKAVIKLVNGADAEGQVIGIQYGDAHKITVRPHID